MVSAVEISQTDSVTAHQSVDFSITLLSGSLAGPGGPGLAVI